MAKELILDAKLDSAAAEALRSTLSEYQAEDVVLNASQVELIGGLCLEVILSAQHHWTKAGRAFSVSDPSESCSANLVHFGVNVASLTENSA